MDLKRLFAVKTNKQAFTAWRIVDRQYYAILSDADGATTNF